MNKQLRIITNLKNSQVNFRQYAGLTSRQGEIKNPLVGVEIIRVYTKGESIEKMSIEMKGAYITCEFGPKLYSVKVSQGNGVTVASYSADSDGNLDCDASKLMTKDLLELTFKIYRVSLESLWEAQEDAENKIRKVFRKVRVQG